MKLHHSSTPSPLLALLASLVLFAAPQAMAGGTVNSGETRAGTIASPLFKESWTFSGSFGDCITITAPVTGGAFGFATRICLLPPGGGAPLACTSPGQVRLDFVLTSAGTHTIVVQDDDLSQAGTYNMTFLARPGTLTYAGDLDGGAVSSGQTVSGTNAVSDLDLYQFSGNAGECVTLTLVNTGGTFGYANALDLYPPTGCAAETTLSTNSGVTRLDLVLPATGTYGVQVHDNDYSQGGSYNLTLLRRPNVMSHRTDRQGGLLLPGLSLGGDLIPSDLDAFQFYGSLGDSIRVHVWNTGGAFGFVSGFDLYHPEGGCAAETTLTHGGDSQLDWQLPASGLYTVFVHDDDYSQSGSYLIAFEKIPEERSPGIYTSEPFNGYTILADAPGELAWDPVPGATGYDLYFGTNRSEPLPLVAGGLTLPQYALPPLLADTTYHWHVVAHTPSATVTGPYLWVDTIHSGVGVPDAPPAGASTLALAPARPNPSRSGATVSLTLPHRGLVDLALYDARGRLVRTLLHEVRDGGEQRVAWDGRDRAGRIVPAGVYAVRLLWEGKALSTRIVAL